LKNGLTSNQQAVSSCHPMALLQPILSARQTGKTIAMFTFIEGLNRSCQIEDMGFFVDEEDDSVGH